MKNAILQSLGQFIQQPVDSNDCQDPAERDNQTAFQGKFSKYLAIFSLICGR